MPRKRKVKRKGAGLGDWASKQVINQAKAAAKAHILPLLKKHLAALEKKLGGQLRRKRKRKGAGIYAVSKKAQSALLKGAVKGARNARKVLGQRRRVARAGSSRLGGSSRL